MAEPYLSELRAAESLHRRKSSFPSSSAPSGLGSISSVCWFFVQSATVYLAFLCQMRSDRNSSGECPAKSDKNVPSAACALSPGRIIVLCTMAAPATLKRGAPIPNWSLRSVLLRQHECSKCKPCSHKLCKV